MDTLPGEMIVKILSFLPFYDQVKCRKVSHSLKNAADIILSQITHLRIDSDDNLPLVDLWSFPAQKFASGPLVEIEMNGPASGFRFRCFIDSNLCPNIQFLDARTFLIASDWLLPIAKSLRYFVCRSFELSCNAQRVLCQFTQLEGFRAPNSVSAWAQLSPLIAKRRALQGQKVLDIRFPPKSAIDYETSQLIINVGIVNLSIFGSPEQFYNLPRNLTQQLNSLAISFFPRIGFCEGPFSNLKYLFVIRKDDTSANDHELCRNLFSTSLQLKIFHLEGPITRTFLNDLMNRLSSLTNLDKISLYPTITGGGRPTFSFPSNVKELLIGMRPNRNVRFTTKMESEKIEYLKTYLANQEFSFPNLTKCCFITQNISPELLISLAHSPKLETFESFFKTSLPIRESQLLINMLTFFPNLVHINLESDQISQDSGVAVLRKDKFPSVRCFRFACLVNTKFHPCDAFEKLQLAKSLTFESSFSRYEFVHQPIVRIDFNEGTKKLKDLKLGYSKWNFYFYDQLLALLPDFGNLETLEVDWDSELALDQFDLVMKALSSLKHLTFARLHHCDRGKNQSVDIKLNKEFDEGTNMALIYNGWNSKLFGDLNKYLPEFTHLHSLEIVWNTSLALDQVQCLIDVLPNLIYLRQLELLDEDEDVDEAPKLRSYNPFVVKQKKIPLVTRFIWAVELEIVFHPADVFETLKIGRTVLFENNDENLRFEIMDHECCSLVFTKRMSRLKKIEVNTPSHLDSQLRAQIKYLRGVEIVADDDWPKKTGFLSRVSQFFL